ncbi:MAG TPA: sulfotransferase [Tepidisphaeraceae bacterium]|nr:sulfotransferase [Tepidisphaeraceae bacterium]
MAMDYADTGAAGPEAGQGTVEYGLAAGWSGQVITSFPAVDVAARPADAATALAEARRGDALLERHDFKTALACFTRASQLQPLDAEYHYKLACAAWRTGDFALVEPHLLESHALRAQHPAVHEALALWYLLQGKIAGALDHSAQATALRPAESDYIITRASVLAADRQTDAAWELLAPLVAAGVTTRRLATAYAQIAPKIGHESRAVTVLQKSLKSNRMSPPDKAQTHFAAAALLDRLGRYDEAFEQARLANAAHRNTFDAAGHGHAVSRRIAYYTPRRLQSLPRARQNNTRPVFIVGMPRSGTSLVEQILAGHPDVFAAGEMAIVSDIVRSAAADGRQTGMAFPECFNAISLAQANALSAKYLKAIDALDSKARYVTDKMPLNFLYLGTLQLLLPGCRVIHCQRDPRDTCLSSYFTDFATGNEFASDLGDLAAFYRDYSRLMTHFKRVLELPILDIRYEDMVTDAPGQTARLLSFLDLPWNERCLAFHENRRYVATASREQVRQPIYASSVGRWRNYEKHLGPVLALGES